MCPLLSTALPSARYEGPLSVPGVGGQRESLFPHQTPPCGCPLRHTMASSLQGLCPALLEKCRGVFLARMQGEAQACLAHALSLRFSPGAGCQQRAGGLACSGLCGKLGNRGWGEAARSRSLVARGVERAHSQDPGEEPHPGLQKLSTTAASTDWCLGGSLDTPISVQISLSRFSAIENWDEGERHGICCPVNPNTGPKGDSVTFASLLFLREVHRPPIKSHTQQ